MELEAINAVAQLIAAIGVIVSLFSLPAQIRQNTRSMPWWAMRRAAFASGSRDYLERSQPIEDLPPIGELIRGESSSGESRPN